MRQLLFCLLLALPAAALAQDTDLELVLLADASGSIDSREIGGMALLAEQHLYQGEVREFRQTAAPASLTLVFVEALWNGIGYGHVRRPPAFGIRSPPVRVAAYFDKGFAEGRDDRDVWETYPEPVLAAYGEGLAHEGSGDTAAAVAAYERAMAAPQTGAVRMLVAHHLARARTAAGDTAGAAEACAHVLHPRVYRPYRGVLWPDCIVWTARAQPTDEAAAAYYRRLVEVWRGEVEHPAFVEARARIRGDVP